MCVWLLLAGCTQPAAPNWQEQVERATQVAHTEHPGLFFVGMRAEVVTGSDQVTITTPLRGKFHFIDHTGNGVEVVLAGGQVESVSELKSTRPLFVADTLPDAQGLRRFDQAGASVRFGPSDLLGLTLEDAATFAQKHASPIEPWMLLFLAENVPARFQREAVWKVSYMNHGDGENVVLVFWVDAQTGAILEQMEEPF